MHINEKLQQGNSVPHGARAKTQTPPLDHARNVVQFWRDVGKDGWFEKDDAVDRRFKELGYDVHFAAARRECEHWLDDPEAALALILLLDQFPRNVFRNTGHMFATDPLARYYARRVVDKGSIADIEQDMRVFICLPFGHSEWLSDHDYVAPLYRQHAPESLGWAEHHRDIIVRFGRFPHRNAVLGRTTTPEEQDFLDKGGFAG